MIHTTRRGALYGLVGLAAAGGMAMPGEGAGRPGAEAPAPTFPWPYDVLGPADVARRAYDLFPNGHCMYAVFKAIVGITAERRGGPYALFPFEMMSYGLGGVASWGSLCGALNGGAAAIALFVGDGNARSRITRELLGWYEATPLPIFTPVPPSAAADLPTSAAASVVCHVSSTRWCRAAKKAFFSSERVERCRRLSADTAQRTAELLNDWHRGGDSTDHAPVSGATTECLSCHTGENAPLTTFGRGTCSTCHPHVTHYP